MTKRKRKIEREGINRRWANPKMYQKWVVDYVEEEEIQWQISEMELDDYAEGGDQNRSSRWGVKYPEDPKWWHIQNDLLNHVKHVSHVMELECNRGEPVNTALAAEAFAAGYTACMIGADKMDHLLLGVQTTLELGLAFDIQPHINRLMRYFVAMDRLGPLKKTSPLIGAIADVLGSPFCPVKKPLMDVYEQYWNTDDLNYFSELILYYCDQHTDCFMDMEGTTYWPEFTRFPVEILARYRLRTWVGLPNPEVDHPLMKSPLGALPPSTPWQPGEMMGKVLARMVSEGYDEDKIYHSYMSQAGLPAGD